MAVLASWLVTVIGQLVTELVTSWLHHKWQPWLSWQHTEQRNEAIRLSSDGSPGYPGSIRSKGMKS
jgi:hypothetical protein